MKWQARDGNLSGMLRNGGTMKIYLKIGGSSENPSERPAESRKEEVK